MYECMYICAKLVSRCIHPFILHVCVYACLCQFSNLRSCTGVALCRMCLPLSTIDLVNVWLHQTGLELRHFLIATQWTPMKFLLLMNFVSMLLEVKLNGWSLLSSCLVMLIRCDMHVSDLPCSFLSSVIVLVYAHLLGLPCRMTSILCVREMIHSTLGKRGVASVDENMVQWLPAEHDTYLRRLLVTSPGATLSSLVDSIWSDHGVRLVRNVHDRRLRDWLAAARSTPLTAAQLTEFYTDWVQAARCVDRHMNERVLHRKFEQAMMMKCGKVTFANWLQDLPLPNVSVDLSNTESEWIPADHDAYLRRLLVTSPDLELAGLMRAINRDHGVSLVRNRNNQPLRNWLAHARKTPLSAAQLTDFYGDWVREQFVANADLSGKVMHQRFHEMTGMCCGLRVFLKWLESVEKPAAVVSMLVENADSDWTPADHDVYLRRLLVISPDLELAGLMQAVNRDHGASIVRNQNSWLLREWLAHTRKTPLTAAQLTDFYGGWVREQLVADANLSGKVMHQKFHELTGMRCGLRVFLKWLDSVERPGDQGWYGDRIVSFVLWCH